MLYPKFWWCGLPVWSQVPLLNANEFAEQFLAIDEQCVKDDLELGGFWIDGTGKVHAQVKQFYGQDDEINV